LQEAQLEILQRLARAEYRDDCTGQHTLRVSHLAGLLGRAIGLPAEHLELLRRAAPLHDVGKIGIPDAILLKLGKVTAEEYIQIKTHTEIGCMILSGNKFPILQMAERIALYHHERWDGHGYHGLIGDAIPLEARIVSLVDASDVITHARPYKEGNDHLSKHTLFNLLEEYGTSKAPSGTPAKGSPQPMMIETPLRLEEIVPGYLSARREELPGMIGLLAASDFKSLAILGHNLKGSGTSYGFSELTRIGAALEQSAKQTDSGAIGLQLMELTDYLSHVQLLVRI
jgi:putative two-component system response regulator